MKKIRALAIAPYEGLKNLIENVANDINELEVDVFIGDMVSGTKIVKQMQDVKYDIIISRAGTADLISEITELPVIDIKLSIIDMMRAIKLAQGYTGKFGVVGYKSITEQAFTISQLNETDMHIKTFDTISAIDNCLLELKEQDVTLIVGDVITTNHAKMLGLNSILVTSGRESVSNALQKAIKTYKEQSKFKQKQILINEIISHSDELIFSFDHKQNIFYTSIPDTHHRFRKLVEELKKLLKTLINEGEIIVIKTISGDTFNIEGKVLFHGNAIYPTFYIKKQRGITFPTNKSLIYENIVDSPKVSLDSFPSANALFKDAVEKAKSYAKDKKAIIIYGDRFTGKNKLAYAIYQNSNAKNKPLIVINSKYVNQKQWLSLLEDKDSPFLNKGYTIYIRNIHLLNSVSQQMLETYFINTQVHKRNRFIFSSSSRNYSLFKQNSIIDFISNDLGALSLDIPNLNERREDISTFVNVFLSELIPKYGKQVLGVKDDAMYKLINFNWTMNINQLKKVVEELIILTDSFYIEASTVNKVLANEALPESDTNTSAINLNKTLDEINRDIIELVLTEENFNQSEAAKRLGVSRSTIWRWLK